MKYLIAVICLLTTVACGDMRYMLRTEQIPSATNINGNKIIVLTCQFGLAPKKKEPFLFTADTTSLK